MSFPVWQPGCAPQPPGTTAQGARVARFGDNMREVAVTEGDKVEAQIRLGYSVNGYGVGDLVKIVNGVSDADIDRLVAEYDDSYVVAKELQPKGDRRQSLREAARIELGMRTFLEKGDFKAFTTTFEDLNGLAQLPGLAVQRLMADGYGFGAEGDWKTAALVRAMKVMGSGLNGGTSFMEDYTYDLAKNLLPRCSVRICSKCAPRSPDQNPALKSTHFRSVAKMIQSGWFSLCQADRQSTPSLLDMGNRFRMVVNEVDVIQPRPATNETAGCQCCLGSAPQPQDRRGCMDHGRWRSPHRLQPVGHH